MARPYCYQSVGWGTFFEIDGPWKGPCTVTLILVADFSSTPFTSAMSEAIQRWNAGKVQRT
jgi:hypothetical protein